jgi:hypothetical protein
MHVDALSTKGEATAPMASRPARRKLRIFGVVNVMFKRVYEVKKLRKIGKGWQYAEAKQRKVLNLGGRRRDGGGWMPFEETRKHGSLSSPWPGLVRPVRFGF